jgi:uncharacterized protein YbbC (DUF1343 family)
MKLPGVRFVPLRFTPDASKFSGQPCQGVQLIVTDRAVLEPFQTGMSIACMLRKHHPTQWQTASLMRLLGNRKILDALLEGRTASQIVAMTQSDVERFLARRKTFLLY